MKTSKKPKALVVDDEAQFKILMPLMMVFLAWDCEVVDCPEAAVSRINAEHFDVVITDFHMPKGNGFHFLCCLRRDGFSLPAIVMSGDAQVLRDAPKEHLNIVAVLLKPFTTSDLQAVLKKVVL